MNKLRLIKIYELRGKVHPIEASIIDLLDGIEEEPVGDYIVYMKNRIIYFNYHKKSNNITYPGEYINFKCSYDEKITILKYLLEKHLKIKIDEVW